MRVERRAPRNSEKDQKLRPLQTRLSQTGSRRQEFAETWVWLSGFCPFLFGP